MPSGLKYRDDDLHQRRSQQHKDHRVSDRVQKLPPQRTFFLLLQHILPVLPQPFRSLRRVQALL